MRYSILINPIGFAEKFWGTDWVVKLQNLYTKVSIELWIIEAADDIPHTYTIMLQTVLIILGPNHTVEAIIRESVLINIFCDTHLTLEKNFMLNYLSIHHSDLNMMQTYKVLC